MKYSLGKLTQLVCVAFLVVSTFSVVAGQADSCSQINGGTFSNMWGSQDFRHTQFCNTPPAEVQFNGGLITFPTTNRP